MNDTRLHVCRTEPQRRFQAGMLTTLTGVLILVLLTLMMFFAVRVGIFDQRVSANDLRQKRAFHTAESGIQHAKEYLRANSVLVAASFALPNGTSGWLSTGAERWQKCSLASLGTDYSHPCFAEGNTARRADLYYWSYNGSTLLPLNTGGFLPAADESVEVQALLCVLDVDYELETPVKGCSTDTTLVDGSRYFVTLMSRGQVECDGGDCGAEATLREAVANFGATAGGQAPAIPLTTKTTFPPTGAAEVVANPNGGGVGVPTSVWMNQNPACSADGSVISPSQGSWATCELHEWYETESIPASIACPGSCSCAVHEAISYTHGSDDVLGIDLILDDEFPCDLFQSFFGIPRTRFEIIKSFATVLSDCSTLGPNSFGVYWISGSECRIQANVTIGSPQAPVLLISAAGVTRMAGGAVIFGVLYIADVEVATASFESLGTNIVYGQVVLDGQFGSYQGTFQVVYNEDTILRANGSGELGNLIGGWADFHAAWQ
jgi:hypothetical protein